MLLSDPSIQGERFISWGFKTVQEKANKSVYTRISHLNIIFNLLYKFRKHSFAVSPAQRDDDLPERVSMQKSARSSPLYRAGLQSWSTEHTHTHLHMHQLHSIFSGKKLYLSLLLSQTFISCWKIVFLVSFIFR